MYEMQRNSFMMILLIFIRKYIMQVLLNIW